MRLRCLVLWLVSCPTLLGTAAVSAQEYPTKPIRIVTGGIGGAADFAARLIAQGLSGSFSHPAVVENRGGIIPMESVAKAPPDGHTLLLHGSTIWLAPLLQARVPYDPQKDFSPISLTSTSPNILVVHPSLPVKNVRQLIALAKAKPGMLNYASAGLGGSSHLAAALFNAMADVNIVGIMYKGSSAALTDLISGEVQLTFNALPPTIPHIKTGRLKGLAVTSAQPSALLPDFPTIAASGVPGYEAVSIIGILAPAKTPAAIVNLLNQNIVRTLKRTDVKEKFFNTGVQTVGSSPEQFALGIKYEMAKWAKVFKAAGIRPN